MRGMDTYAFTIQGFEYTVVRMPAKEDWPEAPTSAANWGKEE